METVKKIIMKKYLSIDIETTGLDPEKHQIVEFAAVLDDFSKPVEEQPHFRCIIKHEHYVFDPYCVVLHAPLFHEMQYPATDTLILRPDELIGAFYLWLEESCNSYDEKHTVAGKNFGVFDYQFLKNLGPWPFRHRFLDVGNLCVDLINDDKIPDLQECLKRCNIDRPVTHTALDDARNVCRLVRSRRYENKD